MTVGVRALTVALGALAFAFVCSSASAAAVGRSEFDAFNSFMDATLGNGKQTVGFGPGGQPMVTTGVPGTNAVGNMDITHATGGWPVAGGGASMNTPVPGQKLPLNVKVPLNKAATAAAIGRFAAKVVTPLVVGMALYDLAKELGYGVGGQNVDGSPQWMKPVATGCTALPCYLWTTTNGDTSIIYYTQEGACRAFATNTGSDAYPNWAYTYVSTYGTSGQCVVVASNDSNTYYPVGANRGASVGTTAPVSGTLADLVSAIAAQSGWPSGSAIDRAVADTVNGGEVTVADSTPVSVTSTTPTVSGAPYNTVMSDGSTRTDQMSCGWVADLFGAVTFNCWTQSTISKPGTTSTSTTITTNPDGTTTTSSVTSSTPSTTATGTSTGTATPSITCGLPGTPACRIDETGTRGTVTIALDEVGITADSASKRSTISGSTDKGWFSSWSGLWAAPPVAACVPITYPPINVGGTAIQPPNIDPCPVVSGMRLVMAFVWAIYGFWLCLGMVRECF
jgi:hypothetical protein